MYIGRVVGVGLTEEGKPAVVYGVSGRSPGSMARVAHRYPTRVFIGSSLTTKPYDKLTELDKDALRAFSRLGWYNSDSKAGEISRELVRELSLEEMGILRKQIEDERLIFYDGIKTDVFGAVVSNGRHTRGIHRSYDVEGILRHWGPELDGPDKTPYTPRIAGLAELGFDHADLGITSRPREVTMFTSDMVPGYIDGLSTYDPDPDKPNEIVINYSPSLLELPAKGETSQELADALYKWMDPKFVVCTAAAVHHGKWDLAVRNRTEAQKLKNMNFM